MTLSTSEYGKQEIIYASKFRAINHLNKCIDWYFDPFWRSHKTAKKNHNKSECREISDTQKNPTGNKTRCKMEEMSNRRWWRNGRKKCRFWVSVSEFGQNVIDVCFASVTNWFLSRYEVEFGASAMYLWLIVPAISLCFLPFDFRHFYIHMCAQCRWERAEDQNRRCRCMQKFALICHIFWKSKRLNVLSRWWFHYSRFVCSHVLPGNKKPKYKAHTHTHTHRMK